MMFWTLILYIVVAALIIVPLVGLFAPYRWHTLGRRFRRAYGPWLVNFDRRLTSHALLRDGALCLSFWLALLLLMYIPKDSLVFWTTLLSVMFLLIVGGLVDNKLAGIMGFKECTLFIGEPVSRKDVTAFLAEHGALIPGRHEEFAGRFSTEAGYMWIHFASNQLQFDPGVLKPELRAEAGKRRERIVRTLGDEPYTGLLFFLPRYNVTAATELAAMRIMALFALRWRCVMVNNRDEIFTGAEIRRMVELGTPVLGIAKTEAKAIA